MKAIVERLAVAAYNAVVIEISTIVHELARRASVTGEEDVVCHLAIAVRMRAALAGERARIAGAVARAIGRAVK